MSYEKSAEPVEETSVSLEIGIVGLPNVGKSTLFNALTRAHAVVASYPFTTIEPNVGVVSVPDKRLTDIANIIGPDKVTPSTLRLVDIAGLVKGAHQGEGLGNQFLGHIRNVDAVAMVVRCFSDPDIPHVAPGLQPEEDIETIELELALADLATVERRMEKTTVQAKARPRAYQAELEALQSLHQHLSEGHPLRAMELTQTESQVVGELNLLTAKPRMYVANVSEDDLPDGGERAKRVQQIAGEEDARTVVICAQAEADLAEWPSEEAQAYLSELGLNESGLIRLIHAGYELLHLITFFTTTGGKEVRAWTLRDGTDALDAAGQVHTDMRRGFVRAEVVRYTDLTQVGGFQAAREKGLVRLEGRDYLVQDGDVVHIRFNV